MRKVIVRAAVLVVGLVALGVLGIPAGGQSAAEPTVSDVNPQRGPAHGGQGIAITGTDLAEAEEVRLGEEEVESFEVVSDTRILATTPAHEAGDAHVRVTVGGTTSPTSADSRFTFVPTGGAWTACPEEGEAGRGCPGPLTDRRRAGSATLTVLDPPLCETANPVDWCGKVLLAGGVTHEPQGEHSVDIGFPVATQLYDPDTGKWSSCSAESANSTCPGPLIEPQSSPTATRLADGQVLIAGGKTYNEEEESVERTARTQLYNPSTGEWSSCSVAEANDRCPGPMSLARAEHTATRLADGRVLVTGGVGRPDAEVYNPSTGTWRPTGPMVTHRRENHTATLLEDGRVLVAGGDVTLVCGPPCATDSAELYDPDTGSFTRTDSMGVERQGHSASRMQDGRVLVAGRHLGSNSAEVYDPADEEWEPVTPTFMEHGGSTTANLLPDGTVLLTDGGSRGQERYHPDEDTWMPVAPVSQTLSDQEIGSHKAVTLDNGRVLVAGVAHKDEPGAMRTTLQFVPPPAITGVEPAAGPVSGGTEVTIEGFGLNAVSGLAFGEVDVPASELEVDDAGTSIAATSPQHPAGRVHTRVTVEPVPGTVLRSEPSAADQFTFLGPPGAVTDLQVREVTASSVELSFGAPGLNGYDEPPAGDFIVKQARSPLTDEAAWKQADTLCDGVCRPTPAPQGVGDEATVSIGDLEPATTYHYAVRARDDRGALGPLESVEVTTGGDAIDANEEAGDDESGNGDAGDEEAAANDPSVAPAQVTGLAAEVLSADEIELRWNAAGANGNEPPPAEEYVVKQSREPLQDESAFEEAFTLCGDVCRFEPANVGERLTLTVGDLDADTTYHYAVRARDGAGTLGPISDQVAVTTTTTSQSQRGAGESLLRMAGTSRTETAVAVSQAAFPNGASQAVLARADAFPDALAATALATEIDGPLLLTASEGLSSATAEELDRLAVDAVYLAGGTAALSDQVAVDAAALDADVRRLGGSSRFATAAAIAGELVRLGGPVDGAIIARADDFADALAAGNVAAAARMPILLTNTSKVPSPTVEALSQSVEGDAVLIAGGRAAVGEAAEAQLEDADYQTTRHAGSERYATAVALADAAVAHGAGRNPTLVASGRNYPDALAAVPAAHAFGGTLQLVDPDDLETSTATRDSLRQHADTIDTLVLVGGPAAISGGVADQLADLLAEP